MIRVYSIGELERVTGVPRTTVHYYLRQGLLPRPQKTAASRSLYTEEHVQILREIGELKRAGRSIAEIEAELQHRVDQANEVTVDLVAQERERMHNRILALAAREFSTKGYMKTHVTSIMRQLGITATVFYSHFPSKRKLLAECVSALMRWSLAYADEKMAACDDPAERLLWDVFSHSWVFELGTTGTALVRVEGIKEDAELRKSLEQNLAATVAGIMKQLPERPQLADVSRRSVPDELIAQSLFGAYEQTVTRLPSDKKYSREELLRAHLWLFLAVQAALSGEIDIDSRLARYEGLISQLGTKMPPLPPEFQL